MACKEGQFDVVELMVNNQFKTFSINLNAQHVIGMTPFDLALSTNYSKLASFFSRFWKSYCGFFLRFKANNVERNVGILYLFVLHSLPRCFSRCSDAVYWSLWCGLICLMFNMMFVQNAKAPNKQREASCCTGQILVTAVTAARLEIKVGL